MKDLIDPSERKSHVQTELAKLSGKKTSNAAYTMICCPFHNDANPSGRVSHDISRPRSIGWYRCYAGCREPMNWQTFAAETGLQPFGPPPPEMHVPKQRFDDYEGSFFADEDTLRREDMRLNELGPQAQEYLGLDEPKWRGFSFKYLKSIGAKCAYHKYHAAYYVYLPVNVNGEERGYIKATPLKPVDKGPSYLNAPGTWSLDYGLFLFDQSLNLMRELKANTLVLVEGPRDGMRLHRYGIPAVSILGTRSWSTRKVRLLEAAGVERIVLCLDGDDAGESASKFLLTGRQQPDADVSVVPLRDSFRCVNFALWEYEVPAKHKDKKLDPGNMPAVLLRRLQSLIT